MSPFLRLSALLCLATGLSAQVPTVSPTGPSYPPPRTAPATFQTRIFVFESDGFSTEKLELTAGSLRLSLVPSPVWTTDRLPNASAGFRHRVLPDVQWTLSLRSFEGFLPALDADAMAGYVRGLRMVHRNRVTWLPTTTEFNFPELRGVTLFAEPLVVRYRLAGVPAADAEPDAPPPPPTMVWDFFIPVDERQFLVASFQAPEPVADATFPAFEEMLVSLERPE